MWVWSSVRHECWLAWALLPTAAARLDLKWSSEVTSVDASLHGFGVTVCDVDRELVGQVGRASKRCRFRGELRKSTKPRDVLDDVEVPFSFLARGK